MLLWKYYDTETFTVGFPSSLCIHGVRSAVLFSAAALSVMRVLLTFALDWTAICDDEPPHVQTYSKCCLWCNLTFFFPQPSITAWVFTPLLSSGFYLLGGGHIQHCESMLRWSFATLISQIHA